MTTKNDAKQKLARGQKGRPSGAQKPAPLFSLKMRASAREGQRERHISGAEKIVAPGQVEEYARALVARGLHHAQGAADFLNLKIEAVRPEEIQYVDAPPVTTVDVATWQAGRREVAKFLRENRVANVAGVMRRLRQTYAMRGAMLLDVRTLKRLEPDPRRGVRATNMDAARPEGAPLAEGKNHYAEAIVLAAKVMHCPGIVGEICISDDPGYVTGYVASRQSGYRRITKLKPMGSRLGGRIFLFDSALASPAAAIAYLEKQCVIVRGVPPHPEAAAPASRADREAPLRARLAQLREARLLRETRAIDSAQGPRVTIGGRKVVLLASNSYLDLTAHPLMKKRCAAALAKYGFGAGGSRLTTGDTPIHERLEQAIAAFKETEAALLFNSGYAANAAIIPALAGPGDVIFSDELNHASIIDGCRLSRARVVVYRHNDLDDLEAKIRALRPARGLVVSDAVFSMDGDVLPLPGFLDVCERHGLLSMIDEAHANGVLGASGRGLREHFREPRFPDVLMGTLSKAVGAEGGYAAGSQALVAYLRNTARGFIFSTAMSPVTAQAALTGLELILAEPGRARRLRRNVATFCAALGRPPAPTPIIPIVLGDAARALAAAERMWEAGFFVPAIRYPTVPKGAARLRVSLMATHAAPELRRAAGLLREWT